MSYRDIMRGPQLKQDYDKYQQWLSKSTEEKQLAYRSSRVGTRLTYTKQIIYIAPFGQAGRTLFVETKGPATGQTSPASDILGFLAGYFETAKPAQAGDIVVARTLFPVNKMPKLVLSKRVTTATNETKSRITGREYKHHETNSCSMVFGKKVATDNFSSVVNEIREVAAYKTFIAATGNTAQFIPEG
jgi:hypothetical protein